MPYSDNIYSANDDSDVESFSDELSPTDGYFTSRSHPQDVMLPNPAVGNGASESSETKEEESRAEPAQDVQETSQPASSQASPRTLSPITPQVAHISPLPTGASTNSTNILSRALRASGSLDYQVMSVETSPLLHEPPPGPPAYSVAIAQHQNQPRPQSISRNYHSISASELESGRHQREGLSDPTESTGVSASLLSQHKAIRGKLCVRYLLALMISIVLVFAFTNKSATFREKSFYQRPEHHGMPHSDHSSPGTLLDSGSFCKQATINVTHGKPAYEFYSGKSLEIHQVTDQRTWNKSSAPVHTVGVVIVRRIPKNNGDQSRGLITIEAWVSDQELPFRFEWDPTLQAMIVATTNAMDLPYIGQHCESLTITVWLPADAAFDTFQIRTSHLSVKMLDDVDLRVFDSTHLVTQVGNVEFPPGNASRMENATSDLGTESSISASSQDSSSKDLPMKGFSSRETYIETSSGSVHGNYPLYDKLSIVSSSGSFNIGVQPRPVIPSDPKPAHLHLSSGSGSISAMLPIRQHLLIPERNYITHVSTHSGSIRGDYIIGTSAVFKSTSGTLHELVVLPTSPHEESYLETRTLSGSTQLIVLSPLMSSASQSPHPSPAPKPIDIGDDDPYSNIGTGPEVLTGISPATPNLPETNAALRKLESIHAGSSGSVHLVYPPEWEGSISSQTSTGSLHIGGDGVRIIKDGRPPGGGWFGRKVTAVKGDSPEDASSLSVSSSTGSVHVVVG